MGDYADDAVGRCFQDTCDYQNRYDMSDEEKLDRGFIDYNGIECKPPKPFNSKFHPDLSRKLRILNGDNIDDLVGLL